MRPAFLAILAYCFLIGPSPGMAGEPPAVRAVVNGQAITSDQVDARQYDLIGKETIVTAVLDEDKQLTRNPQVQGDLKALMAAVVQENPERSREEILKITNERAVVYTQTLAVRRVKPKLFADVEARAINELIDEQLMLQEAKRLSVTVDETEVEKLAADVDRRAGAEDEKLHKLLVAWDKRALSSVKARLRAGLAWKAVLAKKSSPDQANGSAAASQRELAALRASAQLERR
jgi:peptidyl-prolyl cis-trans isomerase SurA